MAVLPLTGLILVTVFNNQLTMVFKMIGDRIKQLRIEKGLSQQEFGARLGTSSGYVSEIENGKKQPGSEILFSLKREFNIDLNWLVASTSVREQPLPYGVPRLDPTSQKIVNLLKDLDEKSRIDVLVYTKERVILLECKAVGRSKGEAEKKE